MSTVLSGSFRLPLRLGASAATVLMFAIAGAAAAQVRVVGPKADAVRAEPAKAEPLKVELPRADAAAPAPVKLETVMVVVDHAKVLRLPEKAQTVIIGNPGIADVSVQKNGVMVVTGKSFGVTNLIALDAGGALLAESLVRVRASSDSVLTVQRGLDRESYSCTPMCQPSVQLGDGKAYFGEVGDQATKRNAFATGVEGK